MEKRLTARKIIKNILPYGIVQIYQNQKRNSPFFFEVHVVEHCNLNCKGCSHFSCLAKEEYMDVEIFAKDCKRLSRITKNISRITLLGGEPLLHPKLTAFFEITRTYFKKQTHVRLITNGVLLGKQSDEFWKSCAKNNISIEISNYPIRIDREQIKILAGKYKVELTCNNNVKSTSDPQVNLMYKIPLDLEGKQSPTEAYANCPHPGCITLRDGKIYRCCTMAHIRFFNEHFGTNLYISEDDYIDIYDVKKSSELADFKKGPFPFCRYCKSTEKVYDIKWARTSKDITEWT